MLCKGEIVCVCVCVCKCEFLVEFRGEKEREDALSV